MFCETQQFMSSGLRGRGVRHPSPGALYKSQSCRGWIRTRDVWLYTFKSQKVVSSKTHSGFKSQCNRRKQVRLEYLVAEIGIAAVLPWTLFIEEGASSSRRLLKITWKRICKLIQYWAVFDSHVVKYALPTVLLRVCGKLKFRAFHGCVLSV